MNLSILAGDLGGTKTLLGIFAFDGAIKSLYQKKYLSKKWNSLDEILNDFTKTMPKDIKNPTCGCIAVAGPVVKGSSRITNLSWNLNEEDLCKKAGLEKLEIINDFCGLIYSLPFLKSNQQVPLQNINESKVLDGSIAIIGAGTGLGIAKGYINKNEIITSPSEGGHSEFAPRSNQEWDLSQWLKADLNLQRLSVERVVSGTGLGHIANWRLSQADAKEHPLTKIAHSWRHGSTDQPDLPAIVSRSAEEGDPLMKEVLKIWLGAYGSAAGDLALQELCYGGLWIGGGTAAKHIKGLSSDEFLTPMQNKGRFKPFLKNLQVVALTDPEAGLYGAACRARMLAE